MRIDKGREDAAVIGLENLVGVVESMAMLRLVADKRDDSIFAAHDSAGSDFQLRKLSAATSPISGWRDDLVGATDQEAVGNSVADAVRAP